MPRRPIPAATQELILLSSRRRCCICFGLHRTLQIKQGQIAHLDHDSFNNSSENLVFLCLDHHDQYDGRTSQSKGFTVNEVKAYRTELEECLKQDLSAISIRSLHRDATPNIDGVYIRLSDDSAEIRINRLASRRYTYQVSGFAVWGTGRSIGANVGELEFTADLLNDRIIYKEVIPWSRSNEEAAIYHEIIMTFRKSIMHVSEKNWIGVYGMNVNFEGEYKKVVSEPG